jgi:D-xylose 1-dehydrogenase (NADP+, D-xylono-1,5-lactone-forming)
MSTRAPVRWGILETGSINRRFLAHTREAANAEFVAVGSRTPERAAAFAAEYEIPRSHGSYEALLGDPAVDAVYVCLPNSLHHEWTMRALDAGKHVLCEKPYSRHAREVVEAFDRAEAVGLGLMEAIMFRHTPQARRFAELLPEIGAIQAIRTTFSFAPLDPSDVRLVADLDGGSLMDLGTYCISGSRLVAGSEPDRVLGERDVGPSGVDVRFTGILHFPNGTASTLFSGFTSNHARLEAVGTDGFLILPDPWNGNAPAMWLGEREIRVQPQDPYRLEVENFSAAILGDSEPLLGREDALGQARTIEALYRSADTGRSEALGETPTLPTSSGSAS